MDRAPIIRPHDYNSDIPADELPEWGVTDVQNAVSVGGYLQQALPFAPVFGSTIAPPRYLVPNQTQEFAYWVYAADAAIGVTDGTTHADITPAGMTTHAGLNSPFTGGVLNQIPVVNSLQNGPWYWDQVTTNIMLDLPGWPGSDTCNAMRPFREFLIALNIDVGGQRIGDLLRWSDAAAPGAIPQRWDAADDTQAGERSVSFNAGQLVDGMQLGDRFFMYKTSSCYVLDLVGGSFIFTNRPVFSTLGLLARDCVVEWRGRHIVLTDGDLVMHDGTTVTSLIHERQAREIFDNLDGVNFDNSYLVLTRGSNQLAICRPRIGELYPTEALILSLDEMRFGKQSLISTGTPHAVEGLVPAATTTVEKTWATKTTRWNNDPGRWNSAGFVRTSDHVILADVTGLQLQQIGEGNDQGGAPIEMKVERVALDLGDSEVKKLCVRVWPTVTGAIGGEIYIQIGGHDDHNREPAWEPEQLFTIGTDRFLTFDIDDGTYYVGYRFRSVGQVSWRISGIKLEIEDQGKY